MISIRTVILLSTGLMFLVIWYFVGGKDVIAWQRTVRQMAALGWDLSVADIYRPPRPLMGISLVAGTTLFLSGLVSLVMDGIRRYRRQ